MSNHELALTVQNRENFLHVIRGRSDRIGPRLPTPPIRNLLPLVQQELTQKQKPLPKYVREIASLANSLASEYSVEYRLSMVHPHMQNDKTHVATISTKSASYVISTIEGESVSIRRYTNVGRSVLEAQLDGSSLICIPMEKPSRGSRITQDEVIHAYEFLANVQEELQRYEQFDTQNKQKNDEKSTILNIRNEKIDKIKTRKDREKEFELSMMNYYVTSGALDRHMARHRRKHTHLSRAKVEKKELAYASRFLEIITGFYNEEYHPEFVTVGAEKELSRQKIAESVKNILETTQRDLKMSKEDLIILMQNLRKNPDTYSRLNSTLRTIRDSGISIEDLLQNSTIFNEDVDEMTKITTPPGNTEQVIGVISYFSHVQQLYEYAHLEEYQIFGNIVYEPSHLFSYQFYPYASFGLPEIHTSPSYNEQIQNIEELALVKTGQLEGAHVHPQTTTNVELSPAHTEKMDANAIGIASGILGIEFTKKEINNFAQKKDYYTETFQKVSYPDGIHYARHKVRLNIRTDVASGIMEQYDGQDTNGTESRVFKKTHGAVLLPTKHPHYFRLDKSHWHRKTAKALRYDKLTSVAIRAVQRSTDNDSMEKKQLIACWEKYLADWNKILEKLGMKNIPQAKRYRKVDKQDINDSGVLKNSIISAYDVFLTQLIIAVDKRPEIKQELQELVDEFQNSVEEITHAPRTQMRPITLDVIQELNNKNFRVSRDTLVACIPPKIDSSDSIQTALQLINSDPRIKALAHILLKGKLAYDTANQYAYIQDNRGMTIARINTATGTIDIHTKLKLSQIQQLPSRRAQVTEAALRQEIELVRAKKDVDKPILVMGVKSENDTVLDIEDAIVTYLALKKTGRKFTPAWVRLRNDNGLPLQIPDDQQQTATDKALILQKAVNEYSKRKSLRNVKST